MLPVEFWAVILMYLPPIALFNILVCSKMFYVLFFVLSLKKKFNHSKLIVSNFDIFDNYSDVWMSFAYQLYDKLKKNFDEDLMLVFKKKLLSDVIFDTLPFRVYDCFFDCDRGFYVHNKCNFCTWKLFNY